MHAVFCEPPARPSARKRLPSKKSLLENVSLAYKSLKAISKNPHNTSTNTTSLLPESP